MRRGLLAEGVQCARARRRPPVRDALRPPMQVRAWPQRSGWHLAVARKQEHNQFLKQPTLALLGRPSDLSIIPQLPTRVELVGVENLCPDQDLKLDDTAGRVRGPMRSTQKRMCCYERYLASLMDGVNLGPRSTVLVISLTEYVGDMARAWYAWTSTALAVGQILLPRHGDEENYS